MSARQRQGLALEARTLAASPAEIDEIGQHPHQRIASGGEPMLRDPMDEGVGGEDHRVRHEGAGQAVQRSKPLVGHERIGRREPALPGEAHAGKEAVQLQGPAFGASEGWELVLALGEAPHGDEALGSKRRRQGVEVRLRNEHVHVAGPSRARERRTGQDERRALEDHDGDAGFAGGCAGGPREEGEGLPRQPSHAVCRDDGPGSRSHPARLRADPEGPGPRCEARGPACG